MFSHLSPNSPFPFEALPPILRGAVAEVSTRMSAPVALVTGSALAAASIACQDVVDVERPGGIGRGPVSLFVMTIAASGERKTSVDRLFFDPIVALERRRQAAYETERQVFEGDMAAWNAKGQGLRTKLRDSVQRGRATADVEVLIAEHQRMKPVAPRDARILFNDVTPGALLQRLAHGSGSGALHTNEAGSLVGGRGFSDIPALCSMWDGQDLKVDRLENASSFWLPNPRLTCSLMIQPGWFVKFCQRHDEVARSSGLLARMLLSQPPSTMGGRYLHLYRESRRQNLDMYNERIADLLTKQRPDRERKAMPFNADAAELWTNAYNAIENNLRPGNVWCEIPDYASKAPENIARLAAIFNLLGGDSTHITRESVQRAIHLMGWYLVQFDLFFGRTRHLHDDNENGQTLLRWLLSWSRQHALSNFITTRDLSRYGPSALRRRGAWEPAVQWLQWRNLASLQVQPNFQLSYPAKDGPKSIIFFHQEFFNLRNSSPSF